MNDEPIELHSELITAEFDSGFVVRPGDTLIIGSTSPMTQPQADLIRRAILERLPNLADVVVLSQVTIQGVYRGEVVPRGR